jgi:hypothetical protein
LRSLSVEISFVSPQFCLIPFSWGSFLLTSLLSSSKVLTSHSLWVQFLLRLSVDTPVFRSLEGPSIRILWDSHRDLDLEEFLVWISWISCRVIVEIVVKSMFIRGPGRRCMRASAELEVSKESS